MEAFGRGERCAAARRRVAVDGDVIVDIDPRREPLADDKRLRRQRFELAALDRLEQRAPAALARRRKRAVVEFLDFSASAALASASENSCRCRSGASTHLSPRRTAFSTAGLSRGLRTRAGTIATR